MESVSGKISDEDIQRISLSEAVDLGATDGVFFSHYFFPKTVRQDSPEFHYGLWDRFLDPNIRNQSEQVFRGGAKTSFSRLGYAWRVSYAFAHVGMYIGKSEGHAKRAVGWLKRSVDRNVRWATAFGLRRGEQWTGVETEILHGVADTSMWILAAGIEGAVRGVNIDDYRPEFIVLDDVINDENAATPEQREKVWELILGAVKESLTPRSEEPNAKLLMINTPLDKEDASMKTKDDPEWTFHRQGVFTIETEDGPEEQLESAWPTRYPVQELIAEKKAAVYRNKLSIWLREKECKLVDPETSSFKESYLRYWGVEGKELPLDGVSVLSIDPVPPPSDIQIAKGMRDKDYEVLMVTRRFKGEFFVCEYKMNRGHTPQWTEAMFWYLALKWRIRTFIVESIAYQRTLKVMLENSMKSRGIYFEAKERPGPRRSKYDKIVDPLSGPLSQNKIYLSPGMTELQTQILDYPNVSHDDLVDTLAMGIEELAFSPDMLDADLTEEGLEPLSLEFFKAP